MLKAKEKGIETPLKSYTKVFRERTSKVSQQMDYTIPRKMHQNFGGQKTQRQKISK